MYASTKLPRKSALFVSALLGGVIFTSCASSNQSKSPGLPPMAAPLAANQEMASTRESSLSQKAEAAPIARSRPQLIKKAAISLTVNSVEQTIDAVSQIINQQQGDLIGLKQQQPKSDNPRHTATIQLRIPENLLESTLEKLAKLGTINSRNITAEDVGDRLVDFQARLTNLRKTEANLQKIMDRAGSVRDVLTVSQELSNVRQTIEQIDAQLKNLQNQVAYSTITLNLEAAVSSTSPQPAFGLQVQETWNNSTHSLSAFSVGLLKLGIWLIVYSPYLLIFVAVVYGFTRWRRTHSPRLTQIPESTSSE
jgi:flagellar biosynthesis chaperone FliJ